MHEPKMNQAKIHECIEALCEKGCDEVNRTIQKMEQGETVEEAAGLAADEHQVVLQELKSIMAVYQERG